MIALALVVMVAVPVAAIAVAIGVTIGVTISAELQEAGGCLAQSAGRDAEASGHSPDLPGWVSEG